ncbi:LysR family transcriptional regulator [Bradyrhizobium sp. Gha]|uniref:LysR family transcriptional regulator n=1 Tax=Bradyrhizobium sp. Gha TaxID=1855318 RepID=UPI0008E47BC5|nr:LysR family transcriptional regulator [Bradyrhizobium sp. Gha]SFI10502.1 LysR family transcriptional regulator, nitrogen assimilation regulatory protein [Bradyrhizobium sp. Gha]
MNLRRLQYFVKIVDVGSLTQAADVLHVAQPALSQQLATLEGEVRQQLLVRTKSGVVPTEAGKVLYRHAQLILRQCEQARADMNAAAKNISGAVAVGLAPGTAAAGLALPLLAVLYGGKTAVHGLSFQPLLREPLYLVGRGSMVAPPSEVPLAMLVDTDLYLARPYNVVRKMVNDAFAAIGKVPNVVAEIESASTLTAVISDGLGATILPESMARQVASSCDAWQSCIIDPVIEAPLVPVRPLAAFRTGTGDQRNPAGAGGRSAGKPPCA